jgi:large subunit ribosomal protein L31
LINVAIITDYLARFNDRRASAQSVDFTLQIIYYTDLMKAAIHPTTYRYVVFEDLNNSTRFLTRSTVASTETVKWEDGNEYPLVKIHISSSSHPFFTGEERILDIEGRVDKFKARAAAGSANREARAKAASKQAKRRQARTEEVDEASATK